MEALAAGGGRTDGLLKIYIGQIVASESEGCASVEQDDDALAAERCFCSRMLLRRSDLYTSCWGDRKRLFASWGEDRGAVVYIYIEDLIKFVRLAHVIWSGGAKIARTCWLGYIILISSNLGDAWESRRVSLNNNAKCESSLTPFGWEISSRAERVFREITCIRSLGMDDNCTIIASIFVIIIGNKYNM